jgi:hypothetical protein
MVAALVALPVLAPAAAPADNALVIRVPATLVVEHPKNVASGTIHVKNTSKSPVPVYLSADDFVAQGTGAPLGTTVAFSAPGGTARAPVHDATIPPGGSIAMNVEITNVWEAGESTAKLYNHGQAVETLRAVKYRVPLAVRLLGTGENPPVLKFRRGVTRDVLVKNDDGMTYYVDWRLVVGDAVASGKGVVLPPNGTGTIAITPERGWFGAPLEGFFKDEVKDGTLTLRFSPGAVVNFGVSEQSIALRAELTFWPLWLRQPITMGVVFAALLAGGLCSLLLNQWFPNRIRRVDLEERLGEIATRNRNLSFRIDSSLRILVRVERYRLLRLLDSRYTFSPEMAEVLVAAGQAVGRLEAKVALLERIDTIEGDLRRLRLALPPSLTDEVQIELRKAVDRLRSPQTSETELQEADRIVAGAAASIGAAGQADAELVASLLARFDRLRKALDPAAELRVSEKGKTMVRHVRALLQYVEGDPPPQTLRPEQYFEHDARLVRLELVHDYLSLVAHQGDAARERLEKKEGELLALVAAPIWDKTIDARRLLREMRDDIYLDQVEREIREKRVRIVAQPSDPRPHQAVELSAVFVNDAFNGCGAREELTCEWYFKHDDSARQASEWQETGWKGHHFFPRPAVYEVVASFRRQDGTHVAEQSKAVTVTENVTVGSENSARFGSRTRIEAVRFGIVLVATIVGLVGGARDQLMKLDVAAGLIAVFLIGFGADAVKNIIVDRGAVPKK